MEGIEVKVEPHSQSMNYYSISFRKKRRINLFNSWRRLEYVWDGVELSYDQPMLFDKFEDAENYAKKLKANPKLIEEHYKNQDEIYQRAKERRSKHANDRNKSLII